MATIYLVKGYLDVAATTLADAQALLAALADPSTAANSATIGRVTDKLETLVQSDSGEPLTISSIDDTAGTVSSWVTDATTTLAFAVGDADPTGSRLYAFTSDFTIAGTTRTATLILNTAPLAAALTGSFGKPGRGIDSQFSAQIRKTNASGFTETVGLLPITVWPGVITTTPSALEASTISAYVAACAASAASASASAVATAADRVQTGLDAASADADATATAADRVQTGLDAVATAADRVQTGLDRASATASASAAAASAASIALPLSTASGGLGANNSAATGVPLFSAGVNTFVATEGSGSFVRATSPTLTTPNIGVATATSATGPAATNLTLAGGSSGASLALGQGTAGNPVFAGGTGTRNLQIFAGAASSSQAGITLFGANTSTNMDYAQLNVVQGNRFDILTGANGTGTARQIILQAGSSSKLSLGASGTTTLDNAALSITSSTASTSTTTGALIVGGGIGAAGSFYPGGVMVVSTDTLSGAGAVSVTKDTTKLTSSGVAQALTLANGVDGQIKRIIHDVDGGSMVLTPTTKTGFSTVTFTNAGDSVTLEYVTTRGWIIMGSYGVTIA